MMDGKHMYPRGLTKLTIIVLTAWMCVLPPCSAETMAQENLPVGSTVSVPSSIATSPATSTTPKKFGLPNPADLGFGRGGYGGQTVPGGGLGGFNGGFGGCCGGFGYNGFGGNGGIGYDNGPLFFGSATTTRLSLRSMVAGNGFTTLLMTGAAAMFYM